jgi:hypothetical protein
VKEESGSGLLIGAMCSVMESSILGIGGFLPCWKDCLRFMERRDRIGLIPRSISLILADVEHHYLGLRHQF